MALNPFFQQGTPSEQNLVQDLINEQIRMYGVEFVYMPRNFVNVKTIMREVSSSTFDQSIPIEGYIESYEGFDSGYNLLTKFGVRSTAEMKIVISQERYKNVVLPLVQTGLANPTDRPNEGDLLYFPYRDLLLEIKYVDDVSQFYQLRKNYTYTLTCEPFEYEDEVIDTGIAAIDDDMATVGYDATLKLVAVGSTASMITTIVNGGIGRIDLLNGGINYTADPRVKISPPVVSTGITATAVAITTNIGFTDSRRVQSVFITNPGAGYTTPPTIQFLPDDGKGSGATGIVAISTTGSVGVVTITNVGTKYTVPPTLTFDSPPGAGTTATAVAVLNDTGGVSAVRITNAGSGYVTVPSITVSAAGTIGVGTFSFGEIITGQSSLTTAFVTSWDAPSLTLTARNLAGDFNVGELIVDNEGSAYRLHSIDYDDNDAYNSGDDIQVEADDILNFTEKNPFGEV